MPSRLQKFRRNSRSREASVPVHQNNQNEPLHPAYLVAADANPRSTTDFFASYGETQNTEFSTAIMTEAKYNPYANSPKSLNGQIPSTIRTVPSFEAPSDTSSDSPSARNSGFSSSVNSNASGASYFSRSQSRSSSTVRLKGFSPGPETQTMKSSASPMSSSNATLKASDSTADPSLSLQIPESSLAGDQSQMARESSPQWDSTIGKASLGKTGRVINKLVSDNEALKRDIKFERIKAEESKQAAKLMEDRMERMASEYESRLLEANVTKTLLSRKERQVEHLQSSVELEKKRTAEAVDRERIWREEMEKSRRDATVQVEEAKTQAALMEGRYNAIASHWKDQGDQVKRTAANLHKEIVALVDERRKDDEKIVTLRDLCDQQDSNIRDLKRQKDEIGHQFERYKMEQENALAHIKTAAREREEEQLRTIEETKRVLGELRWALNVKKSVASTE